MGLVTVVGIWNGAQTLPKGSLPQQITARHLNSYTLDMLDSDPLPRSFSTRRLQSFIPKKGTKLAEEQDWIEQQMKEAISAEVEQQTEEPVTIDQENISLSYMMLQFFFLMLTISLFSSMDNALLISKCFRSMPLHASSSWHLSITYMPSTPCSPSPSHAYHLIVNNLIPCLFLIIYTLFTICTPCSFLIIYIHIPYVFHTSTMLYPSI